MTKGFTILFSIVKIDRKSTRLNSSHSQISYAVFCLKKKKKIKKNQTNINKTIFSMILYVVAFLFFMYLFTIFLFLFFFNDTATTEIYTLSLHDALPIFHHRLQTINFPDGLSVFHRSVY